MSTVHQFITSFQQNYDQHSKELNYASFCAIISKLLPSKTTQECTDIFTVLDIDNTNTINVDSITSNKKFISFLTPSADGSNSDDSFVPNDNFEYDEEKQTSHMLSFQDVEILQHNLREIFKSGPANINFETFCSIIQNMVPSPETNDAIKSIYNELIQKHDNNTISYKHFLEKSIFHKFLKNLGFIILNKTKTISNEELENAIGTKHDKFYFRALSIHNIHDREIILSEAETIQKLKHWIEVYGKPAQLTCQNLQIELDEHNIVIDSLKKENAELSQEIMDLKDDRAFFLSERLELLEQGDTLHQQVSMVHEEMELLTFSAKHSEDQSNELNIMKLQLSKSKTSHKNLRFENENLKEMNFQKVKQLMDEKKHIQKQLKDMDLLVEELQIDKKHLQHKMSKYESEVNLLESENAELMQEIEFFRSKPYNDNDESIEEDVFAPVDRYRTITTLVDPSLDINTTAMSIEDYNYIGDANRNENDSTQFIPLNRKSTLESMRSDYECYYRTQIIELKQQLLDEQHRTQELHEELELRMEQDLKDSMRRSRTRSPEVNVLLVIKDESDDQYQSTDELQPFIKDNDESKKEQDESKCCRFLFGIC